MLVLSRKPGEKVIIGDKITITIVEVKGNRVRVGIDAPGSVPILPHRAQRVPRCGRGFDARSRKHLLKGSTFPSLHPADRGCFPRPVKSGEEGRCFVVRVF